MKNSFTALLPALALLTLGSCAGTSALTTSTETDGVYYSSKDKTVLTPTAQAALNNRAEAQPAASAATGDANPEYSSDARSSASQSSTSSEYYNDDYSYAARIRRFDQPYRGLGLGYYDLAYTDPFWYGGPSAYYGYGSPYGGFYDPFYSPYYGFGSIININIGFGRPYYRPSRYGYGGFGSYGGYGGYDPFYGYGGYGGYGGGYYGGNYGSYGGGGYSNYGGGGYLDSRGSRSSVNYGPRREASSAATSGVRSSGGRNGQITEGGVAAPGGGVITSSDGQLSSDMPAGTRRDRSRIQPDAASQPQLGGVQQGRTEQPTVVTGEQPRLNTESDRGRQWRTVEPSPQGTTAAPADYSQPRRQSRSRLFGGESSEGASQPSYQQPQRSYQQPSRSFEQPSRSFEQPSRSFEQPSRSYSEPSRSYSPSSSPGNSESGGGGRGRGRIQ